MNRLYLDVKVVFLSLNDEVDFAAARQHVGFIRNFARYSRIVS
jgi:hypothetical protein